jgi:hypothetical protein
LTPVERLETRKDYYQLCSIINPHLLPSPLADQFRSALFLSFSWGTGAKKIASQKKKKLLKKVYSFLQILRKLCVTLFLFYLYFLITAQKRVCHI